MTWLRTGVAALRVRQWLHFTVLPAAALAHGSVTLGEVRVARGALIAALGLAYAYGLNAITDRGTDDRRKNPLSGASAPPLSALAGVLSCGLGALAVAATAPWVVRVATLICVAAGTAYSVGPRLKAIPFVGTFTNVAIFTPLLALGLDDGPRPTAFDALTFAFVATLLQNQLLHEVADADEDRRAGVWTTGRLLGARSIRIAVALIGLVGCGGAVLLAPRAHTLALVVHFLAVTAVASWPGGRADQRRLRHRWVGVLGGALVFSATWVAA